MKVDITKVIPTGKGGKITKDDVEKYAAEQKLQQKPVQEPAKPQKEDYINLQVLATPAVRALAGEMKIDITKVKPTGKGGKTTKEDVMKCASEIKKPVEEPKKVAKDKDGSPTIAMTPGDKVVKLEGLHYLLSKMMTESQKIPHINFQEEIAVDRMTYMRKQYQILHPDKPELHYMSFFIKAFSQGLLEYPYINGITDSKKIKDGTIYEFIQKAEHNVGICIDTPKGLIIPNIKSVQNKSIIEINEDLIQLIDKAKKEALTDEDMSDGTFTISNTGSLGAYISIPMLFYNQIGTASLGVIRKSPSFVKNKNNEYQVIHREIMSVSASFDHRIIEGPVSARFVKRIKEILENIDHFLITFK